MSLENFFFFFFATLDTPLWISHFYALFVNTRLPAMLWGAAVCLRAPLVAEAAEPQRKKKKSVQEQDHFS